MATTGDSAASAGAGPAKAVPGGEDPDSAQQQVLAFAQLLDVRVGKVISCTQHPDAER